MFCLRSSLPHAALIVLAGLFLPASGKADSNAKGFHELALQTTSNRRECIRAARSIYAEEVKSLIAKMPGEIDNPAKPDIGQLLAAAKKRGKALTAGGKPEIGGEVVLLITEHLRLKMAGIDGEKTFSFKLKERFNGFSVVQTNLALAHLGIGIETSIPDGLDWLRRAGKGAKKGTWEHAIIGRLIGAGCGSQWPAKSLALPAGELSVSGCRAAAKPIFDAAINEVQTRFGDQLTSNDWRSERQPLNFFDHPWLKLALKLSVADNLRDQSLRWPATYLGVTDVNKTDEKIGAKLHTFGYENAAPDNGYSSFQRGLMLIASDKDGDFKRGLEQLGKAWGILPVTATETGQLRRLVEKGCRFDRLNEIAAKAKN